MVSHILGISHTSIFLNENLITKSQGQPCRFLMIPMAWKKGVIHDMLCQNCGRNEGDKTFVANWMGTPYEVHICEDCLEQMWQFVRATGQKEAFITFTGWWPGKDDPMETTYTPFPQDIHAHFKKRIQLASMKARMEEAAEKEDYEEAARLRDRIASMEKEEVSHDS